MIVNLCNSWFWRLNVLRLGSCSYGVRGRLLRHDMAEKQGKWIFKEGGKMGDSTS